MKSALLATVSQAGGITVKIAVSTWSMMMSVVTPKKAAMSIRVRVGRCTTARVTTSEMSTKRICVSTCRN